MNMTASTMDSVTKDTANIAANVVMTFTNVTNSSYPDGHGHLRANCFMCCGG